MGHRTMQGKIIDLDKLMSQNELMPAIGNMKVNARCDELGPGGKIIKKREDVVAEYYENNPKAVPDQSRIITPATAIDKKPKSVDKEEE
jgi:hypothetical protein